MTKLKAIGQPMPIPDSAVAAANALAAIAAVTAGTLEAYPMAPPWLASALSAAASTAAYLGGAAVPSPALPGGPLVPLAAVPILLVLSSAANITATHLGGWPGALLMVAASILAGLAGRIGPQQTIPTAAAKGADK